MKASVVIAVIVLSLSGCFREVKEQGAVDSAAFLAVQGSGAPVAVFVDGAVIADELSLVEEGGVRFRIAPGAHTVRVQRGEQVLAERRIYIGDGETRVITVPRG